MAKFLKISAKIIPPLSFFTIQIITSNDFDSYFKFGNASNHIHCEPNSSLRLALVYFRNGSRTPLSKDSYLFPTEWPEKSTTTELPETIFPYETKHVEKYKKLKESIFDQIYSQDGPLKGGANIGVLTKRGQQDCYSLGKKLRNRYIHNEKLVSSQFSNKNIELFSIYMDRNIRSIRSVLAGMFDPIDEEPAIIRCYTNKVDYYLPNYHTCRHYHIYVTRAMDVENRIPSIIASRRKISEQLHTPLDVLPDAMSLWDELSCLQHTGCEIPDEIVQLADLIENAAVDLVNYRLIDNRQNNLRFAVGLLFGDVSRIMAASINSESIPPLHMFSVQSHTLISMLRALDCYDGKWPGFASYLSLELHQINDDWFVKIVYDDKVMRLKDIESDMIPIRKFTDQIRHLRLLNLGWKELCGFNDDNSYRL